MSRPAGYHHTESTKRKIAVTSRGRKHRPASIASREKLSRALSGRTLSEEHKRKIGLAVRATWQTPEVKKQMQGDANPLRQPDIKAKHLRAMRSSETRLKLSLAGKGKKRTEATRRKISEARRGDKNPMFGKRREQNPNWRGGIRFSRGYRQVHSPNHPNTDSHGYVSEHRLVMEAHLGRTLLPREVVHHINGIKDDNRIENLMLFSSAGQHTAHHQAKKRGGK